MLPKILILVGPTASGKSELAIALAKRWNGEIVNCDAYSLYRGMDIGTAKPSKEQLAEVPHHLIDVCLPNQPQNIKNFSELAKAAIANIHQKNRRPILCGGSMLYIKAVVYGVAPIPDVRPHNKQQAKELFEQQGRAGVVRFLADNNLLDNFLFRDPQRLLRALEVFLETGKSITDYQQQHRFQNAAFESLRLAVTMPRDILYQRINNRTQQMLEKGWIQEVQNLLSTYPSNIAALQSIGYKQIVQFLQGSIKKEDLPNIIAQKTRHLAKRQLTWMRSDKQIQWVQTPDPSNMLKQFEQCCESRIEQFFTPTSGIGPRMIDSVEPTH